MTPWEIAYHFPSKFKDYVMTNFPDGKMPAAERAAQEGASPPTDERLAAVAERIASHIACESQKAEEAKSRPGLSIIDLDLPPNCVQHHVLYNDPEFPYPFGSVLEITCPGRSGDLRVEVVSELADPPSVRNSCGPFKITAYKFNSEDDEWGWPTAWAATPQAAAWVVEAFAWQIAKKGKPQSQQS